MSYLFGLFFGFAVLVEKEVLSATGAWVGVLLFHLDQIVRQAISMECVTAIFV